MSLGLGWIILSVRWRLGELEYAMMSRPQPERGDRTGCGFDPRRDLGSRRGIKRARQAGPCSSPPRALDSISPPATSLHAFSSGPAGRLARFACVRTPTDGPGRRPASRYIVPAGVVHRYIRPRVVHTQCVVSHCLVLWPTPIINHLLPAAHAYNACRC